MVNLTEDGNHTTIQDSVCTPHFNGTYQKIIVSTLNALLAITAFLGNVLIVVAFPKVSSLHPPSKILLGCLATTDLCVGLISQPIYFIFLLSTENSKLCYYSLILSYTTGSIFCGVSLLTLTAISLDRLLALMLGLRYRQVVTLRRIWALVAAFWLSSTVLAIALLFNILAAKYILCISTFSCIITSTFCYTKIYLTLRSHQTQVQSHVHQGQQNGGGIQLNIPRYRKTVFASLWVQITLVVCYRPYFIVVILDITGPLGQYVDLAWIVAISFVILNSSLNPFLYCWKIREVRQAVKNAIIQLWVF